MFPRKCRHESLLLPIQNFFSESSSMASTTGPVWYVSGEETLEQIATRAQRLDTLAPDLLLLAETNINVLAEQVVQLLQQQQKSNVPPESTTQENSGPIKDSIDAPSLIIVDSIQSMMCDMAPGGSMPGGISQVRVCMALLLRMAKSTQVPIVVIGHVTKSGDVAGPRMVAHMVDAVLYLEGDDASSSSITPYRWLRASKNRFGSCQVVGLYELQQGRLVPNPDVDGMSSASGDARDDLEGCAMSVVVEGAHRAMTVEVQVLVSSSLSTQYGKKTVSGGCVTYRRLQLLLGVLQKPCGIRIGKSKDVYVNIVGNGSGSSRQQSATELDLAVTIVLTSSFASIPACGNTAFLAQDGLLGELRPLRHMETRLLQAQRMGFSRVIVAGGGHPKQQPPRRFGMEYVEFSNLKQALGAGLTAPIPSQSERRQRRLGRTHAVGSGAPASVDDLDLPEAFMDDEEDDDEYDDNSFL